MPACVLPSGADATSDVHLDTGVQTSNASDDSTAETHADEAGDTDADGSASQTTSTGEPPDADTSDTAAEDTGDTADGPCGNGKLDPGEACDGDLLITDSCTQVDAIYTGGTPGCDATCHIDTSTCVLCEAPTLKPCDDGSDDPFHALELGCDSVDGWSPGESAPLTMTMIASPDAAAFRTVRRFGADKGAWTARAGSRALLIGTGKFDKPDAEGVLTAPAGSAQNGGGNSNPDTAGALPEALRVHPVDGGSAPFTDCDGENDCSNTLSKQWDALPDHRARDIFYLELELAVPPGTHGYALDLAFFTAHFPEYNATDYNDMVVLWSQSEAYVGNVTYLRKGNKLEPLSLPALAKAGWMIHDGLDAAALVGTGYDAPKPPAQGGATGWLTVEGPAVPGESLLLALAVMDLDDSALDSAILLDNFRWSCGGCDLADGCGLRLAD